MGVPPVLPLHCGPLRWQAVRKLAASNTAVEARVGAGEVGLSLPLESVQSSGEHLGALVARVSEGTLIDFLILMAGCGSVGRAVCGAGMTCVVSSTLNLLISPKIFQFVPYSPKLFFFTLFCMLSFVCRVYWSLLLEQGGGVGGGGLVVVNARFWEAAAATGANPVHSWPGQLSVFGWRVVEYGIPNPGRLSVCPWASVSSLGG